ncbi:MAG: adenylate/guanylate cyclase domain-containing protein [Acidimicrobiia bacterium]
MTTCGTCGTENEAGHKFCSNCGSSLTAVCPNCSTENDPGNKFCFNCGNSLDGGASPEPSTVPKTERRFVSVLFADLVSFTTFSEHRDSEDVRSMLTLYFERAREIIERYGGEVDKFIGDAVMGVWGAVTAHEDDAERATRAAMELVSMVNNLGEEINVPELALRAGVLSGDTAVGPAGNDKGLVVGDLVNTASRLQSIASPGSVFIGGSTKDLVEGNIELVSEGEHEVKGKADTVAAYRAIRVVSDRGRLPDMLEGPFVGRDDELRILKDQLHAAGREGKARLVSIVGEGGIGKTRLSKELLRYIDGIAEDIYYHHGRSPAYGDGVTFWALGEMVRQRAGIAEHDEPSKARLKLRTTVSEFAPDEEDQRWIEPRLAGLIGLGEMPEGDRSELFAALRTFFLKIADRGPVLMVFEDIHWADDGLLDFIDELVERTVRHPILVLTLARPELLESRRDWGSNRKRTLSMHLGRIEEAPMRDLVAGLAPGMPADMVESIAHRTAGVPLHAVEFVRMLINSGDLVLHDTTYEFVGDASSLQIPDSVNAIISARLDRLNPAELALVQDASVLGYSFTLTGVASMADVDVETLSPIASSLVRREILEFDEDPRSPERGQYRFVQGLILEVAYARLTKSEKVERHLSVARQLTKGDDMEVAGVIASHYVQAVAADEANADLAEQARAAIVAAAERAASLHSHAQAAGLFSEAIALTPDGSAAARLKIRMSTISHWAGQDGSTAPAYEALAWYTEHGDQDGIAAATTEIATQLTSEFRADEAAAMLVPIYESTERSATPEWSDLATSTSRILMLANRQKEAIEAAHAAMEVIEKSGDSLAAIETLITRGTAQGNGGQWFEGLVTLRGAADLAREFDFAAAYLRATNNFEVLIELDERSRLVPDHIWALAERVGDRTWDMSLYYFQALALIEHGRFEEATQHLHQYPADELPEYWQDSFRVAHIKIAQLRESFDPDLHTEVMQLLNKYVTSEDPQLAHAIATDIVDHSVFASHFEDALSHTIERPENNVYVYDLLAEATLPAAGWIGDLEGVRALVDRLPEKSPGRAATGLIGFAHAFEAGLDDRPDEAAEYYREADELWSQVGAPSRHAMMRAVFAKIIGPDTALGHEAGSGAKRFFDEAGTTLFLDLFAEALPEDTSDADEAVLA